MCGCCTLQHLEHKVVCHTVWWACEFLYSHQVGALCQPTWVTLGNCVTAAMWCLSLFKPCTWYCIKLQYMQAMTSN